MAYKHHNVPENVSKHLIIFVFNFFYIILKIYDRIYLKKL